MLSVKPRLKRDQRPGINDFMSVGARAIWLISGAHRPGYACVNQGRGRSLSARLLTRIFTNGLNAAIPRRSGRRYSHIPIPRSSLPFSSCTMMSDSIR